MQIRISASPAEFLVSTDAFRAFDPIGTNVASTQAEMRAIGRLDTEPAARWWHVESAGAVIGVAFQTPPRALALSTMSIEAAQLLAEYVEAEGVELPGADGPLPAVTAFADRYANLTGADVHPALSQRMLAAYRIVVPRTDQGSCRPAVQDDLDTVVGWIRAFTADALGDQEPPTPVEAIQRRISTPGTMWIWDVDGRPTSLCWQSRPATGVVRISAVYTPPEERGHGYASANVAAVSQRALDQGAVACMLYTDRTNPTSNKIYEAIGYAFVTDCMRYAFSPAAGSTGSAPAS